MKTISKILFLATVLFAFSACSSDDNSGNVAQPSAEFYVNAHVDGTGYSNSSYFDPTGMVVSGVLMVQSSTDSGNSIQIQIPAFNGVGTYTSGNNNLTNGYINYLKKGSGLSFQTFTSVRGNGAVKVTEVTDTYVAGTFSAVAKENTESSTASVTIAEGSFKVKK